jgi:F-type H+-transporting ATPase subunit b
MIQMPFILSTFGDVSSPGLGALGVNGGDFLIQIVSFIIVFLILRKYAFKPILKIMAERRKLIDDGVTLGQEMKAKQAKLEDEIAAKLRDARTEADKIISAAQQDARELVLSAEESAKQKMEQISAEAQERIKRDTALARKQLEGELIGLISEATEAIIDEKVDAHKDAQLIDKALKHRGTA